jgi:hypothetical protein
MKILFFAVILFCSQILFAQQATEISVSLKTPEGKFVGQVAGGGLDALATTVTAKQIFVLVDLNGGKIAEGDGVKIKFDASQWREDKEKSVIHRVPAKGAKEDECVFKLHIKEKLIYFETPGGKFVKTENNAVITTAEAKNATLFDVQVVALPNQPTNYSVALKFSNGNYLGMVAGGGLNAISPEIGNNQIFTMVDLNGGTLSSGDSVKFIFSESQMREDKSANKIHRVPIRAAKEEECIFKILVTGKNILLQTPGGRFVAASADGKSIITTDKKDETSLITAVPNPAPTVK